MARRSGAGRASRKFLSFDGGGLGVDHRPLVFAAVELGDDEPAHTGAPLDDRLVVAGVSTGEQDRLQPFQFGGVELC